MGFQTGGENPSISTFSGQNVFSEEELDKVRSAQLMRGAQSFRFIPSLFFFFRPQSRTLLSRSSEEEASRITSRLSALGDRLRSLELSLEADQRSQQASQLHSDRKLDEVITVAQNSLAQVRFSARVLYSTDDTLHCRPRLGRHGWRTRLGTPN